MFASLLLVVALNASPPVMTLPAPGDGLGLVPASTVVTGQEFLPPPGYVESETHESGFLGGAAPWTALWLAGFLAAAAAFLRERRSRGPIQSLPPSNVDVIFISGHGSSSGERTYRDLAGRLSLSPEQARYFDWAEVVPGLTHKTASQRARIEDAADVLQQMILDVETSGRWIYLVGHSKGGVTIAELLARWDQGDGTPVSRVVGAALLDPPMASGLHGDLQSLGLLIDSVPDDGGYDPIRREADLPFSRVDSRVNLGRAAGVEVVVIRNPDSLLANFGDHPEGLRVYDLDDGGPSVRDRLFDDPRERIGEAHSSVLHHGLVAECIRNELWQAGGCEWDIPRRPNPGFTDLGVRSPGGGGHNLVL